MKKKDSTSEIQAQVMNRIHDGSVRMKPRIYFTILWLLGITASLAAGLTVAYFINMVTYVVRIQTANRPAYGARQNLSEAIADFPWWALVLSIVLSVAAFWLMKNYGRIYRYKTSLIVISFLAITLVLGIGMSYANIGHSGKANSRANSSEQRERGGIR